MEEKIACILVDIPHYHAYQPIYENLSSFDIVQKKANALGFPVFIFSSSHPKGMSFYFNHTVYALLSQIDRYVETEYEHFIFYHSHMPLISNELTKEIIQAHLENIADFTYAEHYPDGFAPFMISRSTFKKIFLIASGNDEVYQIHSIKKLIELDLNAYDVEIVIAQEDMRFIRESFIIQDLRSFLLVQKLLPLSFHPQELLSFFSQNTHFLRPLPSFIQIEITSACNQKCTYCPQVHKKDKETYLSLKDWNTILLKLKNWVEKITIQISGYGEPLLHPEIEEILKTIAHYSDFQFFIETNGVLLDKIEEKLLLLPNITLFISLDACDKSLYQAIRGTVDFDKVEENIEKMMQLKKECYIQINRMKINEEALEKIFRRWKTFEDRIVIQKYNDFCGFFSQEKVVDLAPLKRFPCWKLQREMFIHSDGKVSLCSQDFDKKHILGNILEEEFNVLWQKADEFYNKHWKNHYPSLCQNCDEWYIFSV